MDDKQARPKTKHAMMPKYLTNTREQGQRKVKVTLQDRGLKLEFFDLIRNLHQEITIKYGERQENKCHIYRKLDR